MTVTQKKYNITISVGIGLRVESIMELYQSYDQARIALQNRFFKGYNKVHIYNKSKHVESLSLSTSHQENLLNAIQQGDAQTALKLTVQALRTNVKAGNHSASEVKRIMREMLAVIDDAFHDESRILSDIFSEDINQAIEQIETFDEALLYIEKAVEKACQWVYKNIQSPENIRDAFLNYIKAHYSENISLNTIADEFHFSPSYFSRYFKSVTGHTFIESITKIRIIKAKEMLVINEIPIKKIYIDIGYNNYNTFRRAFKKIVGVSPEKYRKDHNKIHRKLSSD